MSEPRNDADNRHPGVMFEIIAKDQQVLKAFYSKVFGWHYQSGTDGFAYVHFGERTLPLLGGIGQADSKTPGFEPGHNFYLLVDNLEATIDNAVKAGEESFVPPTEVDGYRFAMIRDPERNPIGLIQPFVD
jgi:predicted enzyme related to lactoylglutathione lyase